MYDFYNAENDSTPQVFVKFGQSHIHESKQSLEYVSVFLLRTSEKLSQLGFLRNVV